MKSEQAGALAAEMFQIYTGPAPSSAKIDAYEPAIGHAEEAAQRALDAAVGRCCNCKHWGPPEDSAFNNGYGGGERRQCVLINTKAISSICELPEVGLESGDYAGSDAQLWVAPHFGCALFEAKEVGRST